MISAIENSYSAGFTKIRELLCGREASLVRRESKIVSICHKTIYLSNDNIAVAPPFVSEFEFDHIA